MILSRGVAGLGDRHAQGCGVQRHLSNERRPTAGGGFDRASQGLAVTHQLIKICCTTWDLSDHPVPDDAADGGDVVPASKTLQIPEALALAQDPELPGVNYVGAPHWSSPSAPAWSKARATTFLTAGG